MLVFRRSTVGSSVLSLLTASIFNFSTPLLSQTYSNNQPARTEHDIAEALDDYNQLHESSRKTLEPLPGEALNSLKQANTAAEEGQISG
jgi:hypothetical protein